jgi:hypothetical protein
MEFNADVLSRKPPLRRLLIPVSVRSRRISFPAPNPAGSVALTLRHAARSLADIFAVFPFAVVFTHGSRLPLLSQKLNRSLIHANHRLSPVIGSRTRLKNVFHRPCEDRVPFRRHTPTFLYMRLARFFFNILPTTGADICSTTLGSTARFPKSRNARRLCPSGGSLRRDAMIFACASPATVARSGSKPPLCLPALLFDDPACRGYLTTALSGYLAFCPASGLSVPFSPRHNRIFARII